MRVILHSKSVIVQDVPGFEREPDSEYADADLTAEEAGRLCYLSGHRPNPKTAKNADYLLNICNEKHYSVLGHASASFYVDGISRNCSHEIIRSRWPTFSEVSQRYVDAGKFEFVRHPGMNALGDMADYFESEYIQPALHEAKKTYEHVVGELGDQGVSRKEARQTARHFLPGGTETKILMSGNLRSWRDFLAQRLAPGADKEIRGVALLIFDILRTEFPGSFQDFDMHGMITIERLMRRALDRHDVYTYHHVPDDQQEKLRGHQALEFIEDVRDILKNGLWTLKADPWEEDKIGSDI